MGIVILPMSNRLAAPLRSFRARTAVLGLGALLAGALLGGLALGYQFGQSAALTGHGSMARHVAGARSGNGTDLLHTGPAGSRALADRVGTLHGRLIRLEGEALNLAKRLGILPEPESTSDNGTAGEPAGGPFVPLAALSLPHAIAAPDKVSDTVSGAGLDELPAVLARLEQDLQRVDATFARIAEGAAARSLEHMAFPSRLPVSGQRISSGFGKRRDPFTQRWARHTGIDIAAPRGTPIVASAGGRVRFAGYRSAYGNTVEIDHGNGLATRYAHAARLQVRRGDLVLPGQTIGTVGSTGRSTGAHLHFEVLRNGTPVEPRTYLGRTEL